MPKGHLATRSLIPRLMEWLGAFNLKYRLPIVVGAGLLTMGSLVGWYHLKVNNDFISLFPERSVLRQRVKDLQASLAGLGIFYVVVETGVEGGMKRPDLLQKIVDLQEFLASTGRIDKSLSVADYLRRMHREMNGGDAAFEVIPDTPEQVAQYLLLIEGKELAKLIDFTASTANIVVRHNVSSSWELSALLKRLEAYIAQTFPAQLTVRSTEEAILIRNGADYLAVNEVTGLFSTLLVIGLIHAMLFMSLRAGFLSLIPNVIPILYNFGLMGLVGIPLNIGTAMIATIAIGIAVDDTVHHMVTYSRQLNIHHDQKIAMFNTMRAQGRPIIYVSLALTGGFLVLVSSNFISTVYFGALAALVMLMAMIAELVLTPILMYSTQLVTLWDMVLLKMNPELVRTAPLFRGLSRWEARKVVLMGMLQSLQPGELALRRGEAGTDMYMVVTGQVRVFNIASDGRERTLARFDPGAIFGEMGLVGVGIRTANVVAESPAEVLRLDFPALERLRRRFPFTGAKLFRNLARVLSERLQDTTTALMRATVPPEGDSIPGTG